MQFAEEVPMSWALTVSLWLVNLYTLNEREQTGKLFYMFYYIESIKVVYSRFRY